MRKLLAAVFVTALTLLGLTSTAAADPPESHPSQGEASTDRNDAGFGGGPHCHVVVANDGQGPFQIRAFPSHTGHAHAGNHIFNADFSTDACAP